MITLQLTGQESLQLQGMPACPLSYFIGQQHTLMQT